MECMALELHMPDWEALQLVLRGLVFGGLCVQVQQLPVAFIKEFILPPHLPAHEVPCCPFLWSQAPYKITQDQEGALLFLG